MSIGKKFVFAILACAVASFPALVDAAEISRTVTVSQVIPISTVRPALPSLQGNMRIFVNAAAWGSSTCRTDAADLRGDDWMLFSVFMSAWRSSKTIIITVDDSIKLDSSDTVCAITLIQTT